MCCEIKYQMTEMVILIECMFFQGLLSTAQLWKYFPDLHEEDYETHIALIHSRFSTNTFPTWERAHPQRYIIQYNCIWKILLP